MEYDVGFDADFLSVKRYLVDSELGEKNVSFSIQNSRKAKMIIGDTRKCSTGFDSKFKSFFAQ